MIEVDSPGVMANMRNGERYMRSQVLGSTQSKGLEESGPCDMGEPWLAAGVRRRIPFLQAPTPYHGYAQLADSQLLVLLLTRRACLMQDSAVRLEECKVRRC